MRKGRRMGIRLRRGSLNAGKGVRNGMALPEK